MLLDFAIEAIHAGAERTPAIIEACRKRARPIIMTTIAMVAGMFPSALAIGAGGEFRAPMAIAVIGGLIVSTLLSLLFVPALFTIVDTSGAGMVAVRSLRRKGRASRPRVIRCIRRLPASGGLAPPEVAAAVERAPPATASQPALRGGSGSQAPRRGTGSARSTIPIPASGPRSVRVTITLIGFDITGGLCGTWFSSPSRS